MKRNSGISSFKKIYYFYSTGLKFTDIKKFLKRDIVWAYDFYVKRMKKPETARNTLYRKLLFIRNLFMEFLQQLTPVRRLLYSVALFIFIWAYLNNYWEWGVFAVFLFNLLLAFELADKLTAKDELTVARDIQSSLMPTGAPLNSDYQIAYYCEPASEVGGDYFDFLTDKNGSKTLSIIIGDISGKGMAAALHMVQVKSIIHMLRNNTTSPKESLCLLNSSLSGIFRNGVFFTSIFLNINNDSSISFSRAGHLPLIHYKRKEERCYALVPKGIGIGLSDNSVFNSNIEQVELNPSSGDIFLLFTDGITETMNIEKKFFGEEMLCELVSSNAYKSAEQIKECILESVRMFSENKAVTDDITLIVLKRL